MPIRNKTVYSCSVKIHASDFDELLQSIFYLLQVMEAFCLQKVVEMLEEVVVGWREVRWIWQMRLHSPMCSTFEVLIVSHSVKHCHREGLAFFCWPILAASVVFGASHRCAEHNSQIQWFLWNSQSCSESDGQQTTKQWPWPFFLVQAWLREMLWHFFSDQSLNCTKFTFCHMSQSDWEMVHCCCIEQEKMTLQNGNSFNLWSAHEAPTYRTFSPFQFASNAKQLENGGVEFFSNNFVNCFVIALFLSSSVAFFFGVW